MKTGTTVGRIMTGAAITNDGCIATVNIADGINAYFTSRGEVTDSPYSGFNVCHYTGDDPAKVERCRVYLAGKAGIDPCKLIMPRQTHSINCRVIDSLPVVADDLENVDALVTSLPGVAIGVSTADCVPVLLADPVNGVIGAAHAGWRGAVGGIIGVTLDRMIALGADPRYIKAVMGPCICKDCFEVGEEVARQFPDDCVVDEEGRKPHVDLPAYVASILIAGGVAPEAVAMPFACTKCDSDRYFSARALGISSGRNFSMIVKT